MNPIVEQAVLKMISFGGNSKSLAFEAIKKAKEKKIEEAEALLRTAVETNTKGREAHLEILAYEAEHPEEDVISSLFVHGADYVANGTDICVLAEYIIDLYKGE